MEFSKKGLDFIKQWETGSATKFDAKAYQCTSGVWTIGFGSIRWNKDTPVKKGEVIDKAGADYLFRNETNAVQDAINSSIKVPLTQNQFDVLGSFGYNVGIGWITGKGHQQATMIKKLNKGDYSAVASGLLKFCVGTNGTRPKGLLDRRKAEARVWLTPDGKGAEKVPKGLTSERMAQGVTMDNPSQPGLMATIGGAVSTVALGVVQAINNPYAMTVVLVVLVAGGFYAYTHFKDKINA